MCYLCKDAGHPAILCPDRPVTEEIMMYGHGIEDMAFFHIEVPEIPPPSPSLLAIVTVVGEAVATPELIEAGSTTCAGARGIGSNNITLALNDIVVNISEPRWDPKVVAVLDTAWLLIAGLPDVARSERVIRSMSKILGKVVVVDELSLRKEEEVRVKVKCLDSSKLHATIRVFFNDDGYDIKICPEPPNHVGRPRFSDDSHLGVAQPMLTTPTTDARATPASTTQEMTRTARSTPAPPLPGALQPTSGSWRSRGGAHSSVGR
ncbi:hypothetical protein VPH35_108575 [Triticum aestivum]